MTLFATLGNPIPQGAVSGHIETEDGRRLRYARFAATATPRRGTIALLQGRSEMIEKYFETIVELTARGFTVATFDWRGQGGSDRALADPFKGHVESFAEYQRDLAAFARDVVLPDCPPPYFALAHSMGGAVLLEAAADGARWFERMVLLAPMVKIGMIQWQRGVRLIIDALTLLGAANAYIPGGDAKPLQALPFPGNRLSADEARYRRNTVIIEAHPELAIGSPTVAWLHAAQRAMDRLMGGKFCDAITIPTLVLSPALDPVVSAPAIEVFAGRLRGGGAVVIPQSRHEILSETDAVRAQFWAAFDAFVPPGQPVAPRFRKPAKEAAPLPG